MCGDATAALRQASMAKVVGVKETKVWRCGSGAYAFNEIFACDRHSQWTNDMFKSCDKSQGMRRSTLLVSDEILNTITFPVRWLSSIIQQREPSPTTNQLMSKQRQQRT